MKSITIILLTISLTVNGQDLKYASINILSSSIISGVGSGIHKHKNETFGKAFINGMWKGAIGGSVQFISKKMVQQSAFEDNYNWIWPARLINSLGNSMVWNGCYNEKILSKVYVQAFIGNVTYSFKDKKFDFQIDPLTTGYAIYLGLHSNYKFDGLYSLKTGSILFNKQMKDTLYDDNPVNGAGQSIGNTVATCHLKINWYDFYDNRNKIVHSIKDFKIQITCHEIIHGFQYSQYNYLKNNIVINLNFALLYKIANYNGYKNNFFENEADYFGYSVIDHNASFH
jgi:hypothetical protein